MYIIVSNIDMQFKHNKVSLGLNDLYKISLQYSTTSFSDQRQVKLPLSKSQYYQRYTGC